MIWEELAKIALIGTERASLPAEVLENLARLGIDTDAEAPKVVLEGAALYHQLQRAGFPLPVYDGEKPPAPGEAGPVGGLPSARAARHLQLILEGRFQYALPEYLHLLKQYGKRIPPEHLPALFDHAQRSPALWKAIEGLLGPFEYWLLRQNPGWASLADEPGIEAWPDAKHEERLRMLRHVRRQRPEEAALLLESCWGESAYPEKQAFLKEMEPGLGPYDESFLEACLDDSRKEVRSEAALLLARLPGSALLERLFVRAQPLFNIEKNGSLTFSFPGEPDSQLKRDGIGAGKNPYSGDKRAGRAFAILSRIPPKRWEGYFNRPTADALRLLAGSGQKKLLLDALANAAILHQDHRWIEAILRYWWRTDDGEAWAGAAGRLLMAHLPGPVFNDIALQHLKQNPGFIEEKSFIGQLLCLGAHNWEGSLARIVINGFQQWLSGARTYYWNLWQYKRILEVAAYRIGPDLLESFRAGWDDRSPVWHRWEREVERFLKVLAFRKDMREALGRP